METAKPEPRKQPERDSDMLEKLCDRLDAQWKRFDQIENRLTLIEQVNYEMKKMMTDVLEQTTSFSNLKSSEKYLEFESESQLGTSVTTHSEDVIDDSNGFKNMSVTVESEMIFKPEESDTNITSSSKHAQRNDSEVIGLSRAQLIATLQSYLSVIEKDCAELKCLVEDGMIPSTESLIGSVLPQPENDVNNSDENELGSNPINNASSHLIEEILPNGNSSEVNIPGALELLADVAETVTAPTSTQAAKCVKKEMLGDKKALQNTVSVKPGSGKLCFLCNDVATIECAKCFKNKVLPKEEIPAYCGQAHKDSHWNSGHEYSCGKKALKLGWKEVRGDEEVNNGLPYYVATKDLEVGLEIFSKKPLFTFPKNRDNRDESLFDRKFPEFAAYSVEQQMDSCVCITCNELMMYGELMEDPLNGIRLNKCPSCEWPVHSPRDVNLQKQSNNSCQDEHAEECEIFWNNQKMWDDVLDLEELYFHLGVLRAVLNEDVKNKLLRLPVSPGPCPYLESISNFVRDCCNQNQVSEQELIKIIHVVFSNHLPSSSSYFSLRKKHTCIIYEGGYTGRILPHACNPNCRIYVDPKTGEATFKTRRKVEKGEMLTISYNDELPQSINERALSLTNYHVHHCGCDKCEDGKDLTSAIKCEGGKKKHQKGCKSKYLMPFATRLQEPPMNKTQKKSVRRGKVTSTKNQGQPNANKQDQVNSDTSNLYFWQCPSCKSRGPRMEQSAVEKKVRRIKREIHEEYVGRQYQELKELIKKYSDEELHPDHSVILLAQMALGCLAVEQMRGLVSTGENITLVPQSYSSDLDKAVKMLERNDNGRSVMYGTLLYGCTLLRMRDLVTMCASMDELNPSVIGEVQTALESIKNNLEESWEIVENNPYLSAIEINRDIVLFNNYSMGLETYAQILVESSQQFIFQRFRKMQFESLQAAHARPPSGSWYLYKVNWDENHDSSKNNDADAPESSENAKQNMAKIELKEKINIISGDFFHELFSPDEY